MADNVTQKLGLVSPNPQADPNSLFDTDKYIKDNYDKIDNFLSINTAYATTTNVGNAYSANFGITQLTDGQILRFKCNADSTGNVTINPNSLGNKNIVKQNGVNVINLKQNGIYTIIYNSTTGNFILQAEGGDIPKLSNLCRNGSYENDLNCYKTSGATPTIVSTGAYTGSKCLKTTSSTISSSYSYQDNIIVSSGHKVYVTAMAYIETYTSGEKPQIALYQNGTFEKIFGVFVDTTKIGQWQRLSFITTMAVNNARLLVGRGDIGVESTNIDAVMVIDLTNIFGAGKEPSKEEMDYIVSQNGNWWDSDLQLLTNDATTTAGDIANTKTAYVNGQLLTGTNTNKRWAIGTSVTVSGGQIAFTRYDGVTVNSYYCTVTHNLGYQPSIIVVYKSDNTVYTTYDANGKTTSANLPAGSATGYTNSGNLTVTTTTFQLPLNSNTGTYNWKAFE